MLTTEVAFAHQEPPQEAQCVEGTCSTICLTLISGKVWSRTIITRDGTSLKPVFPTAIVPPFLKFLI